jgi:hypothetical protein
VLASADVEVFLPVVAVVADVQDLVVGKTAHDAVGVVPIGDVDPECGAARTGVAEVPLDGCRVIGDRAGDALRDAALDEEPLPAVQDSWLV